MHEVAMIFPSLLAASGLLTNKSSFLCLSLSLLACQGVPDLSSGPQGKSELEKFLLNKKDLLVYTLYGRGKKMLGWDGYVRP